MTINAKSLATALWCVNLVHRNANHFPDRPTDEELTSAWMRIEWALRSVYVEVDHAVVAAEQPVE
jgi:hypothetical protein